MKKFVLLFSSLVVGQIFADNAPAPTLLYQAAEQGDLKQVQALTNKETINSHNSNARIDWGEWADEYYYHVHLTPIYGAIYSQKLDIINFLIENGADLNAKGNNWLWAQWPLTAAAMSSPEIFETLLRHGARQGYSEALGIFILKYSPNLPLIKRALGYHQEFGIEVNSNTFLEILAKLQNCECRNTINPQIIGWLESLRADVHYKIT